MKTKKTATIGLLPKTTALGSALTAFIILLSSSSAFSYSDEDAMLALGFISFLGSSPSYKLQEDFVAQTTNKLPTSKPTPILKDLVWHRLLEVTDPLEVKITKESPSSAKEEGSSDQTKNSSNAKERSSNMKMHPLNTVSISIGQRIFSGARGDKIYKNNAIFLSQLKYTINTVEGEIFHIELARAEGKKNRTVRVTYQRKAGDQTIELAHGVEDKYPEKP